MDWFRFFVGLLPEPIRGLARRIWLSWHRPKALARLRQSPLGKGRRHGLPGELIVSLTSYPARFETLHLTLRSLLAQNVKPDRLVLWLAHDDVVHVPIAARELEQFGLEIRECDNLRSYKKLIPALETFPDAFIVTADDDIYFPPDWLESLVGGVELATPVIACRRAHRMGRLDPGSLAPFLEWEADVQDERARVPSADIMPTSGAGALYPPNSLHPMVTDRTLFQRLCPDGDDLWFYWCARMAGTLHKKVGGRMWLVTWAGSQRSSLWETNKRGGNDRMIRALEAEFGTDVLDARR